MESLYNLLGVGTVPKNENRNLGKEVEFTINGKQYKASNDIPADTSLNVFIREHANLKGTKFMCLEGGCGVCVVSVQYLHPTTKSLLTYSVNSCLVPIFACHGWSITTVEGLGNKNSGYHKIQKRLAAGNGSQCGYCTPGQIMNFYSLYESNPKLTMKEIENSLSGNLCRCTGYRPILDVFKSFASDAPGQLVKKLKDIEEMACLKTEKSCPGKCDSKCCSTQREISLPSNSLMFELKDGTSWYRPLSVKEVMEIFDMIGDKSYRFVAGNTGQGVYRIKEEPQFYIDINGIPELHKSEVRSDGITVGANIGLNELIMLLNKVAEEQPQNYAYCKTIADHIDLVANVPVRNVGTLAGNFSLKHQNREFPSDLFLLFIMADATVVIADISGENKTIPLMEYLSIDMNKKIMVSVNLPVLDHGFYITRTYKIMPRAQNAHAYVNAGFKFKVDKSNGYTIMETPTVLFGGIRPNFLHATKTEEYLAGKKLLDDETLKGALDALDSEINPNHILPDVCPEYRKGLAKSLFYKFILSVDSNKISQKNISGGSILERPISSGCQDYDTDRNLWPLNKPIPKIEALIQCSGEAEYVNDMPNLKDELWAQLVLTDRAAAVVSNIDPSEALAMPGVVAFFSAKDIPGVNRFTSKSINVMGDERLFVDGRADYAGQAVGVVVAETNSVAIKAALKVKICYSDQQEIIRDMKKILKDNMTDRMMKCPTIEPTKEKSDVKYKIKGELELKTQYHFTMETQTCLAVPVEDRLEVYPTSQWPALVLDAISLVLNIPENKIRLQMKRLGGAYGAKISRNSHTSAVCSLAAYLLHRPVKMVLKLESNMEWAGKRFPFYFNYETGVNENGEIQYLNANLYQDDGHTSNDSPMYFATIPHVPGAYDPSTWSVKGFGLRTDSPSNTWCRAPSTTEGTFFIENVMERIANVVKKDPISVRLANMNLEDNNIAGMIEDIKKTSEYELRLKDIERFNEENRWKKRGISLIPVCFPLGFWGLFHGSVSIYAHDGTVTLYHGSIEMGQGLNTKAVQVAAHTLGIDVDMIVVAATTSFLGPNNIFSGASASSDSICYAIKVCCEVINERLKPSKQELGPNATWKEIIYDAATRKLVNLNHTHCSSPFELKPYKIYGVGVTEVEVDILTGQYLTKRVDLIQDAGKSISPDVDIGQVEGSIVMGLGYFTYEDSVYNKESGALLTTRTWNYKVPGAKDIPVDFRVTLRKNSSNPVGVCRSKATGEPAFGLSCSVLFAIRNALESARKDAGQNDESWFEIDTPFTPERIWLGGLTKHDMFTL